MTEKRIENGFTDGLIRVSAALEDYADLHGDLLEAFDYCCTAAAGKRQPLSRQLQKCILSNQHANLIAAVHFKGAEHE